MGGISVGVEVAGISVGLGVEIGTATLVGAAAVVASAATAAIRLAGVGVDDSRAYVGFAEASVIGVSRELAVM